MTDRMKLWANSNAVESARLHRAYLDRQTIVADHLTRIQAAKARVFETTHRQLIDAIQMGYSDAAYIIVRLLVKLARRDHD
jgi:hypothetical protein